MQPEDALPQRLLVMLAASPEGLELARSTGHILREQGIPALLMTPPGMVGAAQLMPEGLGASTGWWRERAWVRRLMPDCVLGCDLESFTCQGLRAARSQAVSTLLALPVGRRLPWTLRFAQVGVAPIPDHSATGDTCARLATFLRAQLLGTAAGVARLALSPLALASGAALLVKRD
jgi:hypothetical protein